MAIEWKEGLKIAFEKGGVLSDIDESGVASRIPIRYSYDIKNSFLFVSIFFILYQILNSLSIIYYVYFYYKQYI